MRRAWRSAGAKQQQRSSAAGARCMQIAGIGAASEQRAAQRRAAGRGGSMSKAEQSNGMRSKAEQQRRAEVWEHWHTLYASWQQCMREARKLAATCAALAAQEARCIEAWEPTATAEHEQMRRAYLRAEQTADSYASEAGQSAGIALAGSRALLQAAADAGNGMLASIAACSLSAAQRLLGLAILLAPTQQEQEAAERSAQEAPRVTWRCDACGARFLVVLSAHCAAGSMGHCGSEYCAPCVGTAADCDAYGSISCPACGSDATQQLAE